MNFVDRFSRASGDVLDLSDGRGRKAVLGVQPHRLRCCVDVFRVDVSCVDVFLEMPTTLEGKLDGEGTAFADLTDQRNLPTMLTGDRLGDRQPQP